MRNSWRGTAALAAALLIACAPVPAAAADDGAYRKQIDELSGRLFELQKQKEDVQAQIAGTKSETGRRMAEKLHFEEQIALTREEVAVLDERIALLEEQVADKTAQVDEMQAELDMHFELYQRRLRANYIAGKTSKLELVLGASDMADLLMRGEMLRATAEHDRQLMATMREERAALEEERKALEKAQRAVEADQAEAREKQDELEDRLEVTETEIQDLALMEQEYLSRAAELEEMDRQTQAEIDRVYAKIDNSGAFIGGIFGWPLPGYSTITSYYGNRFGNTNFHTGIDISGQNVYGKSVVASNSGTVAYVQTSYTNGVGYGIHVIVNHGGGYTTLYGHMSSVSVSEGDFVSRGDEIGKVGSTGWSTGPHVHFEVRVNGAHQNPLGFLKTKG